MAVYWQPPDAHPLAELGSDAEPVSEGRPKRRSPVAVAAAVRPLPQRDVAIEPLVAGLAAGILAAALFLLFALPR